MRWRYVCSIRLASGRASGSPNPPASSAGVDPRGSSISASGLPLDSPRIRALTRSSSGPGSSCRAAAWRPRRARPSTASSGNPSSTRSSLDSRTANTRPSRSASSRRATNASVSADTRSSHCASSTMQTSGRSSAASASRLRTASPTRKRSGGGPALRPNAVLSASRCGPGRCWRRPSIGAHSACRPANASSISDSTPAARAIRHPSAASRQVSQQGGLADAGLAAEDEHAALTRAHARDEPLQHVPLALTVDQSR